MASIADIFVTVLPETSKIADGIKKALLGVDDDVRAAAKRWRKENERELNGGVEVDVKADTRKAEKDLDKLEKVATQQLSTSTRTSPKPRPRSTPSPATAKSAEGRRRQGRPRQGTCAHRRWRRWTWRRTWRFAQRRRETRRRHQPESHWRPTSFPRSAPWSARSVNCRACWGCCPRWPVREMYG